MTTPRTVLRQDDLQSTKDTQRPLNEAFRGVDDELRSLPRRDQAWLRFTMPIGSAGQLVRAPRYPVAGMCVLSASNASNSTSPYTAAPWLAFEPVDGDVGQLRVTSAYGLLTTGVVDVLVEFVEDTTGGWARTNVTGGQP